MHLRRKYFCDHVSFIGVKKKELLFFILKYIFEVAHF
jgi:hypothetical protein